MSTTAVRVLVYGNIEEEDAESLNKLILEGIEETAILTDNQVRFGITSRITGCAKEIDRTYSVLSFIKVKCCVHNGTIFSLPG